MPFTSNPPSRPKSGRGVLARYVGAAAALGLLTASGFLLGSVPLGSILLGSTAFAQNIDEGKSAPQFQQKLLQMSDEPFFQLRLGEPMVCRQVQKLQHIRSGETHAEIHYPLGIEFPSARRERAIRYPVGSEPLRGDRSRRGRTHGSFSSSPRNALSHSTASAGGIVSPSAARHSPLAPCRLVLLQLCANRLTSTR